MVAAITPAAEIGDKVTEFVPWFVKTRVCHLRNAQPQARQGLGVFYGIIFCTYKSEYGGRSFEGTEVSTREELVGNGDAESPENQGEVIRAGVEDAEIVTWQPVYLPTV